MASSYRVTISFSWSMPDEFGPWTCTKHWPDVSLDLNRMGIISEAHAERWVTELLIETLTLDGQRELPDNFRAFIHATLVIA